MPQPKQVEICVRQFQKATEILLPYHLRGLENARYYRGQNWTSKDLTAHQAQGFHQAYSIPLIAVKLNRILSLQRANRFDAKTRGRGMEDELTAEVINYIFKYIDDVNQFKWVESEVFQDGLCKLFGVLKVDIDFTKHPLGDISMFKIPFTQFYYDTNALDYNLREATFMGEYKWLPMDTAKTLFKDFDFTSYGDRSRDNFFGNMFAVVRDIFTLNGGGSDFKMVDWLNEKKQLIKICEHYEQNYKQKYLTKNLATGDFIAFDKREEADNYIIDQIAQERAKASQDPNYRKIVTNEDFVVIPKQMEYWKKILFTKNILISETEHRYSRPPYFRYCALFDDGDFWTLTDLAKDPQKAYDRMMSMIDKSTAKNIKGNNYTIMLDRLHPKENKDLNQLGIRLSGGGQFVGVMSHDVIQPINKFNDIRVESTMATAYQSLIEDLLGGRSFQGLDNNTRQTATEVVTIERNATQTGLLFADNLARWKQTVFEYVVELIKDLYTPDRTVRVIGEVANKKVMEAFASSGIYTPSSLYAKEVGYLNLRKLPKPIYECELDIIIDNVESTRLDKDEKFAQIMALNQMSIQAYGTPLPFEFLLQYSKLDPTLKDELEKYQRAAEEKMQQRQQMSADLEKAKALNEIIKTTKPEESQNNEQPKRGSPQQILNMPTS